MDTYVAALLGLPRMLDEEDVDQALPREIDDEFITKDGFLEMPKGRVSQYAACNEHTRLMRILAKVIKYIYPIKGLEQCAKVCSGGTASYTISHTKIREIEGNLQEWLDALPMGLRPGGEAPPDVARYVLQFFVIWPR